MIRCTLLQLYDIRSHFLLPLLTTHEVKIKTLKCILSVFVSVARMCVEMFELRGEDSETYIVAKNVFLKNI